ncbi:RNA-binding protein HI_1333 [Mannheimia haemolytica]|uniref:RNA-binding protein HI_1333 n=1 Tax=Mannheimia haemolytica TaxID=75985 RepID=A0A378N125_MANHA|nr:RNA-binding protein HI_1333 [Mannheimia haemolytica]STY61279.1 RNA-binding protein HI_1333 [Mannheimia haemolytica]
MSITLTTKQKQFLKGLAHHLSPVVMLGVTA